MPRDIALVISAKETPSSGAANTRIASLIRTETISSMALSEDGEVSVTAVDASPQSLDLGSIGKLKLLILAMGATTEITKVRASITWADGTDQVMPLAGADAIIAIFNSEGSTSADHITAVKLSIESAPTGTEVAPRVEFLIGGELA